MIDEELLNLTEKRCGSFWKSGVDEYIINNVEKKLNVLFPFSYKQFLKRFGEGGISGSYIFGISNENFSSTLKKTLLYREEYNIPNEWVVIGYAKRSWEEYLVCLDTERNINEECPVIKYDLIDQESEDFKKDFDEYFNYILEVHYNK